METVNNKCKEIIAAIRDICNQDEHESGLPVISFSQDWGGNSLTIVIAGKGHTHVGNLADETTFEQLVESIHDLLCKGRGLSFIKD